MYTLICFLFIPIAVKLYCIFARRQTLSKSLLVTTSYCHLYQFAFLHVNFPALCRNSSGVTKELKAIAQIPKYIVTQLRRRELKTKTNKTKFQQILKININREVMMMMKALCFVRSRPFLLCLPVMGRIRMQKTEALQKEAKTRTKMWSKEIKTIEPFCNWIVIVFNMQRSQAHTMLMFLMTIPLPRFSFR